MRLRANIKAYEAKQREFFRRHQAFVANVLKRIAQQPKGKKP